MKSLFRMFMLVLLCSSNVYAGYEYIGEMRECAFKAKVLRKITSQEDSLLIIQGRDVYTVRFAEQRGAIKYYSSFARGHYDKVISFEAAIMGPQMARLSEIRIFLSGVMMDCYIEK